MSVYLRKITALLPKKLRKRLFNRRIATYLRAFLFIVLVVLAGITLQILVLLQQRSLITKREYEVRVKKFQYWSSVASQFPNIPDILYNASISSYSVGNEKQALRYVNKALQIDPLFKKAQILKEEILGS